MAEAAAAEKLMTAEEFLLIPEDGLERELVKGRVIVLGGTSSLPAVVAAQFVIVVGSFVLQHRLGRVGGADWGFRLFEDPDTVRVPDAAFVRAERLPPSGMPRGFFPGPPDLALEVMSPSNTLADVLAKVSEYIAAGVRLVWVVDPEKRRATVFRPDELPLTVGADGVLDGEDVLPGFELRLADIWV